jgi:tight adherence protein C
MILLIASICIAASAYFVLLQFKLVKPVLEKAHLPSSVLEDNLAKELLEPRKDIPTLHKPWLPLSTKFRVFDESKLRATSLRRRLLRAGSPIGALEFFAFKLLSFLFVPTVGMMLFGGLFPRKDIMTIVLIGLGWLIPDFWLNHQIKKRQDKIRKDLPNVIDLLNLCVGAGLDFMMAVSRVIKDLKPSELTVELAEVYRQTQIGKSRRDALKNFAWRIDSPEAHSFVRTLVQADRMGTPMSEALKMQAEEMRSRRFQRGEAMALKAPIKLLFPLFFFILPVVLILVAGPVLLQFSKTNIGF